MHPTKYSHPTKDTYSWTYRDRYVFMDLYYMLYIALLDLNKVLILQRSSQNTII